MKRLFLAAALFAAALPLLAQTSEPAPTNPPPEPSPETPPTQPAPAPTSHASQPPPAPSFRRSWYVGGGVGMAFGTIDYVELSPLVGVHLLPRLELGVQPFYRWTRDGHYSPSVSATDYGASIFSRVPIYRGFFAEADYQYGNYEYAVPGGTTRDTYNAFLAGGGYQAPMARNVGVYASALYDFTYDTNDPFRPYDSPWRYQFGVAVGF